MKPKVLEGYNVAIQGRHLQISDAINNYVFEKVEKLERLSPRLIHLHIVLEVQKLEHRVDVVMRFDNFKVKGSGASENMYAAIDQAFDRLQAQVKKHRERIHEHQSKVKDEALIHLHVYPKAEEIFNQEIEAENAKRERERYKVPKVVRSDKRTLKTLTLLEAMMKLDLSQDPFLLYRSEEDRKLKVLYRTKDGNFGVIAPE